MGRWWVILLLLLGVWQIVGSLIEKAGKKQQEQRLKDLAAQRGRQAGGQGQSQPAPTTKPRTLIDRAEALAARRREQLAQLRQRRTGQKPGVQQPTTPAPRAGPAPAATPQPGQRQISQLQPGRARTRFTPVPVARRAGTQPPTRAPLPGPQRRVTVRPTPERVVTPRPAPAHQQEPAPMAGESSTYRVVKDAEIAPKAPRQRHPALPFVIGRSGSGCKGSGQTSPQVRDR